MPGKVRQLQLPGISRAHWGALTALLPLQLAVCNKVGLPLEAPIWKLNTCLTGCFHLHPYAFRTPSCLDKTELGRDRAGGCRTVWGSWLLCWGECWKRKNSKCAWNTASGCRSTGRSTNPQHCGVLMGQSTHIPGKALGPETQGQEDLRSHSGTRAVPTNLELSLALHTSLYIMYFMIHNCSKENDLMELSEPFWIDVLQGFQHYLILYFLVSLNLTRLLTVNWTRYTKCFPRYLLDTSDN